jgi:hypothetical protein
MKYKDCELHCDQCAHPYPKKNITNLSDGPTRLFIRYFFQIGLFEPKNSGSQPLMLDDHSAVVPLLPIPNRNVKRSCADASEHSFVKVGHRQASRL